MKNARKRVLLLLLLGSFLSQSFAKDLILSAPPRETAEAGMKMYGPIATHLSKLLGTKVAYKHPGNWFKYQRDMRNDKYDIIFDGPHFISWREQHLGHEALLKLPGKLQFILVTGKDSALKTANDLIGKNICGIPPPNLSTLSILDNFRNPVRQPTIKGIKGGMGKVFKAFVGNNNKCDAAVLRTAFHRKKLKDKQRAMLKTLYKTKAMPNQGISVSRRVSPEFKQRIKKSLTTEQSGITSTQAVIKRFGGKAMSFVSSDGKEYSGYNNLLEGVIFGW